MVNRSEPDDDIVAALRALPREMAPPAQVRVALARRIGTRPRSRAGTAWRLAVAASLLAAAFVAGRLTAPRAAAPAPAGPTFALLLYGGASGGADDRAAEYAAWASAARRDGRPVSGERLADASWVAGRPITEAARLRGFFIVGARDAAEALDLARRHPHAQVGTVVVRPIDTP